MKTLQIYSIRDRVVGEYGAFSLFQTDEQALRNFNYLMSQTPMVADDCSLYCLGSYDPSTGMIEAFDSPMFICNYTSKEAK